MKTKRASTRVGIMIVLLFGAMLLGCGSSTSGTPTDGSSGTPTDGSSGTLTTRLLLVADETNQRVLGYSVPFTTGQSANLVLGQPDFTTRTPATTAEGMRDPVTPVVDGAGNIYVVDWGNNRVLQFTPPFTDGMSASLVIGQPDFVTATGNLTQNSLRGPIGAAFDSSGNLWVADRSNNRVLRYTPPFGNHMDASLVIGQADFTSSRNATTETGLSRPNNIAFDSAGNLWVADWDNNRVVRFSPPFSNGMAASLVLGQVNFTSSAAAVTQSGMNAPWGVVMDGSGNLWVAEQGNNRVVQFRPPFTNGMDASVVVGQADFTSRIVATTQQNLLDPLGIIVDSSGRLFVADADNARIMVFAPPFSNGMDAEIVIGQTDFTSSGKATTASGLRVPIGLAQAF